MNRMPLLGLATIAALTGCTSHVFAQKTPDGTVYLNGSSGFLFFTSTFIKRCTEAGTKLMCETLTVVDAGDAKADDAPRPKSKKRKPPVEDSGGDSDDSDDAGNRPKKKPKKPDDE